jgi:crotonobetainyl-CoA:carnitine CoA-transferase CaiB-like acyl-CoA transferase
MPAPVLEGFRILDLARGRAGSLAAMLLAEAGADTIRIEPPGGDPNRADPAYVVHNRSKYSLALALDTPAGLDALDDLLAKADALIHDLPDSALGGRLANAILARRFPHLISTHIGSWPKGHPNAGTPVDNALVMAQAGICDEQAATGRDGPNFLRFPLGEGGAAYLAAIGLVARLLTRDRTGVGGAADTSLLQGALTSVIMLWSRAATPTPSLSQGYNKQIAAYLFECADGEWIHVMSPPDRAPSMRAALEAMDPTVRAEALARRSAPPVVPNWGANAIVFKTKPRQEWLEELWANDVSVQPVLPMGALYHDAQAATNAYVVAVEDPVLGNTRQPGSPMQIDPPARVRKPAPVLDDGRERVRGWQRRTAPQTPAALAELPLAGLKVLDLGNFLAGPFAPMLMASMGAEVIKLEAASGDMMRYVDWAFAACQRGKRCIAIDLKQADSRPVLERLVKWADVVHHNLRMPAARKLGLDYPSLKAINPDIVYCHVSSYGPIGPRKDWPGFDQLFQASCGWEYEGAGAGNPPIWHRFGMMDHQCALASLLATLLALHARHRSGQGGAVGASLLGAGMLTLRETVMLEDGSLTPYAKLDSGQFGTSDQRRLFRCADGWAMVITEAAGAHERFLAALGAPDISTAVSSISRLEVNHVIALAQAAGGAAVRAAENQREAFFDDPANREAGLIARYPHPVYGDFEQIGSFINFDGMTGRFDRAPPVLGQHSEEILAEFGFSPDEISAMLAARLVVIPRARTPEEALP